MVANEIRNVADLVRVFTPPEGVHPLDHNPKFKLPYPALISPTAVYERLQEWGAESPFFQALVLGQFPEQAEFALYRLISFNPQWMRITARNINGKYPMGQ
jgi:hypothetical protein